MRIEIEAPGHARVRAERARPWGPALTASAVAAALALVAASPPAAMIALGAGLAFALRGGAGDEVEIDDRQVRWRRRGWWGRREIVAPRSAIVAIVVRPEPAVIRGARGPRPSLGFLVELRLHGSDLPDPLPLGRGGVEATARRAAAQLALATGLPCVDAVGDEIALRDAAGGRPAYRIPGPAGAPPPGLRLEPGDPGAGATLSRHGRVARRRRPLLRALLLLSLPAAAVIPYEAGDARGLALPAASVAEALWLLLGAWLLHGRECVTVRRGTLRLEHWLGGVRLRRREWSVASVTQVRAQGAAALPGLAPGVAVFAGSRAIVLGQGLEEGGRVWLRAWLEQELWPDLPVASPARAVDVAHRHGG